MANAASGVAVDEACITHFTDLKKKRAFRFLTFQIDAEGQKVVCVDQGAREKTYDDFVASLPADDCRYGVYDHDWEDSEGCKKSKIGFFAWSPDTCKVRFKMLYAASKDNFRRQLDGVGFEIQATDKDEVDIKEVKAKCEL